MIAKANRITYRPTFRKVQKYGKVYQSTNFGISYIDNENDQPSKFAFVISTKISKEAVDRNTIKRHMSEAIRIMVKDIRSGLDVVFLAKPSIMRIPASEIVKEIRTAIKEGGFLK
jgi:ribonuclease P protein component